MSVPDAQLIAALTDGAPHMPAGVSAMSADDALTAINTPYYVPRDYRVTWTTIGDVLGGTKAVTLQAGISMAIAGGMAAGAAPQSVQFGATCQFASNVLAGSGFDPANAQAQGLVQSFVTAGLLASVDATTLLNYTYYPAGYVRQLADVTVARAYMADQAARVKISGALSSLVNEWLVGQATAPTAAALVTELQSLLTAAGVA